MILFSLKYTIVLGLRLKPLQWFISIKTILLKSLWSHSIQWTTSNGILSTLSTQVYYYRNYYSYFIHKLLFILVSLDFNSISKFKLRSPFLLRWNLDEICRSLYNYLYLSTSNYLRILLWYEYLASCTLFF